MCASTYTGHSAWGESNWLVGNLQGVDLRCIPVGRGSIRPDHGDVGVSSTTGTQSVENKIWDIQ